MYSYGSQVVSVLLLVPSIGIATGATVATSTTVKTPEPSAVQNGSAIDDKYPSSFIVDTSVQCECVVFYLCDEENVVNETIDDNQWIILENRSRYHCSDYEVCCRISASLSLPTGSQPQTSDLSQSSLPISSSNTRLKRSSTSNVELECGIGGKNLNESSDSDAYFGEFPWMVALFKTNKNSTIDELICAASLLSPDIILTAAHCVNKIDSNSLKVRAGEHIADDQNETISHQDRTVDSIQIHPNYNSKRLYNDLALLKVNEPFHYDTHINSICAPFANSPFAAPNSYNPRSCWTSGWGKAKVGDKHTQIKPQKVKLPIIKHDECQKRLRATKLGANFTLDSSFLCAGREPENDTCKGDGGGPLFCATRSDENKFILVGVTSWGLACVDNPRVFASLQANSEWITTEFNVLSVF